MSAFLAKQPRKGQRTIRSLIHDAEASKNFKLSPGDFRFLSYAIESFVSRAIDKFIDGSREHFDGHGDFVSAVDHKTEIQKEIIDLWMYATANKKRK